MMLPECISWARIGYTYERSVVSYGGEKEGGGLLLLRGTHTIQL